MRHTGVEKAIAEHLLTDTVAAHLAEYGHLVDPSLVSWRSWLQPFESTLGPWGGIGGMAITDFQVTVAVDRHAQVVLVFAGSDLFAHGWTDDQDFWDQYRGFRPLDTDRLAEYGLIVLERRLR